MSFHASGDPGRGGTTCSFMSFRAFSGREFLAPSRHTGTGAAVSRRTRLQGASRAAVRAPGSWPDPRGSQGYGRRGERSGGFRSNSSPLAGGVHSGDGPSARREPRSCPRNKVEVVQGLQREGAIVAMAGDGIRRPRGGAGRRRHPDKDRHRCRDGERRCHAREGRSSWHRPRAAPLSRHMRNIRQNLLFAFGYNALGIPITAGVLYPFTGSFSAR